MCFFSLVALAVGVSHSALSAVLGASLADNRFSHLLIVPPISVVLLFLERTRVFARVAYSPFVSVFYVALVAASLYGIARGAPLSLEIFLLAWSCIAAFVFCYGTHAFRVALFPILFLVLMTPLPEAWFNWTIGFLQWASAHSTAWFFSAAGIPFSREGMVMTLPTVTIEIAAECSGIRSSVVLFLSTLVLGHLFLKSPWSKLALAIAFVPITIFKNAFRIFSLSTLAMYVDPSFLTGSLHHRGGFVFFGFAFVAIWAVVWLLQKAESRAAATGSHSPKRTAPARVS